MQIKNFCYFTTSDNARKYDSLASIVDFFYPWFDSDLTLQKCIKIHVIFSYTYL